MVADEMRGWAMLKRTSAAIAALVLAAAPAFANCEDAIDEYNQAISEIDYQLGRYTRCLSSSEGSDDCSTNFRRLRSAQGDFESAVTEFQRECE